VNLVIDIALWAIVLALGLTLFLRDQPMFADVAALCAARVLALLPPHCDRHDRLGVHSRDLPKELIPSLLGPESGNAGLFVRDGLRASSLRAGRWSASPSRPRR
jgi:hypothetical protein